MAIKKKKIIKTTPVGTASYPWLTKPDTKYEASGEYKTDMIFEQGELDELEEELDSILDDFFEEQKAVAKPQVAKKLTRVDIVREVYDDEGNETGQGMLRFKQKVKIKGKDEKIYTMSIDGFDAALKGWDETKAVYGGSRLKINFEVVPYNSAKDKECGLTLRLRAFQVIELVSSSSASASSYGFGEEEGYEQEETPFSTEETEGTDQEDTEEDDF